MTDIKQHIIVTGLGGSGKTTFARTLGLKVVHCDNHRFGENWSKRTPDEYYRGVKDELAAESCAIEGICNDISDPENARFVLFKDLIESGKIVKFCYFESVSLQSQMENLIARSLGRALGTEPQGTCVETPADIARMLIKSVNGYESNVSKLKELLNLCQLHSVRVEKLENKICAF
jgi:hypothetical protein